MTDVNEANAEAGVATEPRESLQALICHRSRARLDWEWDLTDWLESGDELADSERPLVVRLLQSRDEYVVFKAIERLARAGVSGALPAIWACKGQWDWMVRVAQVEATWDLGHRGWERHLRRRVRDRHMVVQSWAIEAYAALYPACARAWFPRLLRRETLDYVRGALVVGLYASGDRSRLAAALQYLIHPDVPVSRSLREVACWDDVDAEEAILKARLSSEQDEAERRRLTDLIEAIQRLRQSTPEKDITRSRGHAPGAWLRCRPEPGT